ncbi:unnamed protein product [Peronospora destructor]|uniref:Uncharacterized protein n=1 Tax=Peronospora destructor TaxID=86335 RepID=A0AAV0UYK9_9STRA|nr:unnamed protein product [Peronospora destructor]
MSAGRSLSDVSGGDDDEFLDAALDEVEEQETLAQVDFVRNGFFDTGESELEQVSSITTSVQDGGRSNVARMLPTFDASFAHEIETDVPHSLGDLLEQLHTGGNPSSMLGGMFPFSRLLQTRGGHICTSNCNAYSLTAVDGRAIIGCKSFIDYTGAVSKYRHPESYG